MNLKRLALVIVIVSLFQHGCASIISGTTQEMTFQSNPEDVVVTISGKVVGKTPTTVQLDKKSGQSVVFSKDGYKPITMQLESGMDPWFWGNIVLGGVIGSTTDGISGAVHKYSPNQYFVTLQPEGTNRVDGPTTKSQKDKAKEFIVANYERLAEEIKNGEGDNLAALNSLLNIPTDQQEDSLKKMRTLSEVFTDPPTFADQLSALYIK
jgi:RNase P/RNase MRP subunit p29